MNNRFFRAALQSAVLSLLSASVCVGAERAAAIDYEFVERPAGLATDFIAPPNATLRFLNIKAIDGFRVDAAQASRRAGERPR